jgi:hypothetical protein
MKKLFYICTLFVLSLLVTSCGDDDEQNTTDPIVGTWEIYEVEYDVTFVEDGVEESFQETFTTENCNAPITFAFAEDGTLTVSNFEVDFEDDNDDGFLLDCTVLADDLVGTWQLVSGNDFILGLDNESAQVEIYLSNNNTTIEIEITEVDDLEADESSVVIFRGNLI